MPKRFNYGLKNLEEWLILAAIVAAGLVTFTIVLFW